jgi:hypothetical protein
MTVTTSSSRSGAHPAYTLKAPASAYDTDDEYTEYASPRCSRTSWNKPRARAAAERGC